MSMSMLLEALLIALLMREESTSIASCSKAVKAAPYEGGINVLSSFRRDTSWATILLIVRLSIGILFPLTSLENPLQVQGPPWLSQILGPVISADGLDEPRTMRGY